MSTTFLTFVLIIMSSSGYPTAVWNYDLLSDCIKDGERYKTYYCAKIEIKKDEWRK